MEQSNNQLALIDKWKSKFRKSMEEIVSMQLEANPNADPSQIKEDYMLEKLATIFVSSMELGNQIRELEKRVSVSEKNT